MLMKIYTRNGDDGYTYLLKNRKIPKDDILMEVIGQFDELNTSLGILHAVRDRKIKKVVLGVQRDLLAIGSLLAGYEDDFLFSENIKIMEELIDTFSKKLPPLKSFILPGGSQHSSQLQKCRSVARRLERSLVSLSRKETYKNLPVKDLVMYTNRLSDLLFVMARYVNFKLGIKEIIWHPENE